MSLRHALLGLLVDRTASGYDLMKLFDTSLANVWPATQSQVYGELANLCGLGMIEVVAEGSRGRKAYALTEQGMTELRRWLTETRPEQPQRNEALLQVFFLGVLPPDRAAERLVGMARVAAEQRDALLRLRETVDWGDDMLSVNGKLALEYGLRLRAMEEQWARWAAEQITRSSGRAANS
jgi:PadR family transcriptional regulator, regulatory protein AphA